MIRNAILASFVAAAGTTAAQVSVTEIYPGISGEDGTNDWFEVTNTSGANFDTGNLFWDDDGPNALDGAALESFLLAPGESAIFIIADSLTDIGDDSPQNNAADVVTQFTNVWGNVANVGITNGGGNLSQDGDSVNLSFDGGLTFPINVEFPTGFANTGATIDTTSGFADSVVGVNGAYVSNPFFNDNIFTGDGFTLIGSPGIVPAPASAALLGLGGLAAARRRR
ncbi:MAG: PEP-CTERM sorting domain-containing protein [Planctomycetota bacterium]